MKRLFRRAAAGVVASVVSRGREAVGSCLWSWRDLLDLRCSDPKGPGELLGRQERL